MMKIPLFTIGLLLLSLGMLHGASEADPRPNFILFIADDVSRDDFGCYGHPTLRTPHVDALAGSGLRFENAYLTTSSCSPSRTSLITGRYPHNTGAPELHQQSPHVAGLPQFPALLREAGYHTALAGKWHFNGDIGASFDVRHGGGKSGGEKWLTCLEERPKDRPFFLWLAAFDAHRDWDQPLEAGPHGPADVRVPPYIVDGPRTREDLAHYYNEVHRFDSNIGRVVAELRRQGVLENTVIIVMADNGRPFPRDKTWLFDSGIKTPLVIHWPAGIPQAGVVASLVSTIDLPPTILRLAGLEPPASFQGVSLQPLLREPSGKVRDFVFAEKNWHAQRYHDRMVRHGDFVCIRNNLPQLMGFNIVHHNSGAPAFHELVGQWRAGKTKALQSGVFAMPRPADSLFHVAKDPLQLENLAESPQHAGTLARLKAVLDQWSRETGDTVPEFDAMTPDRIDRETWKPVPGLKGHPKGGSDFPGKATRAWTINRSGPVRDGDFKPD